MLKRKECSESRQFSVITIVFVSFVNRYLERHKLALFMVALWNRADQLSCCGFYLLLFSSANLSGRTLDVYLILPHMVQI